MNAIVKLCQDLFALEDQEIVREVLGKSALVQNFLTEKVTKHEILYIFYLSRVKGVRPSNSLGEIVAKKYKLVCKDNFFQCPENVIIEGYIKLVSFTKNVITDENIRKVTRIVFKNFVEESFEANFVEWNTIKRNLESIADRDYYCGTTIQGFEDSWVSQDSCSLNSFTSFVRMLNVDLIPPTTQAICWVIHLCISRTRAKLSRYTLKYIAEYPFLFAAQCVFWYNIWKQLESLGIPSELNKVKLIGGRLQDLIMLLKLLHSNFNICEHMQKYLAPFTFVSNKGVSLDVTQYLESNTVWKDRFIQGIHELKLNNSRNDFRWNVGGSEFGHKTLTRLATPSPDFFRSRYEFVCRVSKFSTWSCFKSIEQYRLYHLGILLIGLNDFMTSKDSSETELLRKLELQIREDFKAMVTQSCIELKSLTGSMVVSCRSVEKVHFLRSLFLMSPILEMIMFKIGLRDVFGTIEDNGALLMRISILKSKWLSLGGTMTATAITNVDGQSVSFENKTLSEVETALIKGIKVYESKNDLMDEFCLCVSNFLNESKFLSIEQISETLHSIVEKVRYCKMFDAKLTSNIALKMFHCQCLRTIVLVQPRIVAYLTESLYVSIDFVGCDIGYFCMFHRIPRALQSFLHLRWLNCFRMYSSFHRNIEGVLVKIRKAVAFAGYYKESNVYRTIDILLEVEKTIEGLKSMYVVEKAEIDLSRLVFQLRNLFRNNYEGCKKACVNAMELESIELNNKLVNILSSLQLEEQCIESLLKVRSAIIDYDEKLPGMRFKYDRMVKYTAIIACEPVTHFSENVELLREVNEQIENFRCLFEGNEKLKDMLALSGDRINSGIRNFEKSFVALTARLCKLNPITNPNVECNKAFEAYKLLEEDLRKLKDSHQSWNSLYEQMNESKSEIVDNIVIISLEKVEKRISSISHIFEFTHIYNQNLDLILMENFDKCLDVLERLVTSAKMYVSHFENKDLGEFALSSTNLTSVIKHLLSVQLREHHWQEFISCLGSFQGASIEVGLGHIVQNFKSIGSQDMLSLVNDLIRRAKLEIGFSVGINECVKVISERALDICIESKVYSVSYRDTFIFDAIVDKIMFLEGVLVSELRAIFETRCTSLVEELRGCEESSKMLPSIQSFLLKVSPWFKRLSGQIDFQFYEQAIELWNEMLLNLSETSLSLRTIREKISTLEHITELTEQCEKCISDFVNMKRVSLARFYFLSDEEILCFLGSTNQFNICQSVRKVFPGIYSMDFSGSVIESVQTCCGTNLKPTDVSINTPVDEWLSLLHSKILSKLRHYVLNSNKEYPLEEIVFDANSPNQVTLLLLNLRITSVVQMAVKQNNQPKVGALISQLESILVTLLKQKGASSRKAIIVEIMGTIDSLRELSSIVLFSKSFEWYKMIKYYSLDSSDLEVEMIGQKLEYCFELDGDSNRLVFTRLTEKCFINLMAGVKFNYFVNLVGPAGTGKTESIKGFAKILGKLVLVFNCGEGLEVESFCHILIGLAKNKAWGCLDEFNRINQLELTSIATILCRINQAFRANESRTKVRDVTIETSTKSFHIFTTMNPASEEYKGRAELPSNLRQYFRKVIMQAPNVLDITRILLYSNGYVSFEDCASSLVQCISNLEAMLSQQPQYDFSLRTIKALVLLANKFWQVEEFGELDSIKTSIKFYFEPRLAKHDIDIFNEIISRFFQVRDDAQSCESNIFFSNHFLCFKDNLTLKKYFLKFKECFFARTGTIVVGKSLSGKSLLLNMLSKELELGGKSVLTEIVDPKSVSLDNLFGYVDKNTCVLHKGIVGNIIENFMLQLNHLNNNTIAVLVFDGDLDPVWVENLNSVLDDNNMLTYANGCSLKLSSKIKIIFECTSLVHISPATISRVNIVSLPNTLLRSTELMNNSVPKCVSFYKGLTSREFSIEDVRILTEGAEDELKLSSTLDNMIKELSFETMRSSPEYPRQLGRYMSLILGLMQQYHANIVIKAGNLNCQGIMHILKSLAHLDIIDCPCCPDTDGNVLVNEIIGKTRLFEKTCRPQPNKRLCICVRYLQSIDADDYDSKKFLSVIRGVLCRKRFYDQTSNSFREIVDVNIIVFADEYFHVEERILNCCVQLCVSIGHDAWFALSSKTFSLKQSALSGLDRSCISMDETVLLSIMQELEYDSLLFKYLFYDEEGYSPGEHYVQQQDKILERVALEGLSSPALVDFTRNYSIPLFTKLYILTMAHSRGILFPKQISFLEIWFFQRTLQIFSLRSYLFFSGISEEASWTMNQSMILDTISRAIRNREKCWFIVTDKDIYPKSEVNYLLRNLHFLLSQNVISSDFADEHRDNFNKSLSEEDKNIEFSDYVKVVFAISCDSAHNKLLKYTCLIGGTIQGMQWLPLCYSLRTVGKSIVNCFIWSYRSAEWLNEDFKNEFRKLLEEEYSGKGTFLLHKFWSFLSNFFQFYNLMYTKLSLRLNKLLRGVQTLDITKNTLLELTKQVNKNSTEMRSRQREANESLEQVTVAVKNGKMLEVSLKEQKEKLLAIERDQQEKKQEVEAKLAQFVPMIENAKSNVNQIESRHLSEVQSLRIPPEPIFDVFKAVLILLGEKDTNWIDIKKFLSRSTAKESILNFDPHRISAEIKRKVERIISSKPQSFSAAIIKRVSSAAAPIAEWLKAMMHYASVLHTIAPLMKEKDLLGQKSNELKEDLLTFERKIEEANIEIAQNESTFKSNAALAVQLEERLKLVQADMDRASKIEAALNEEYSRWCAECSASQEQLENCLEYCFKKSRYICQIGNHRKEFKEIYKDMISEKTVLLLRNLGLGSNLEDLNFFSLLLKMWKYQAIFVFDPFQRCLKYLEGCSTSLKNTGENWAFIDLSSLRWNRDFKVALQLGGKIILCNFETLPNNLFSVMNNPFNLAMHKQLFFEDQVYDVSHGIQFILVSTTREAYTCLSPQLAANLVFYSFEVTSQSLSSHFSWVALQNSHQVLMAKRKSSVALQDELMGKKELLEDTLLALLGGSKNILQDETVYKKLLETKQISGDTERIIAEAEDVIREVENNIEDVRDITDISGKFFMKLQNLANINPIYMIPLVQMENIFASAYRRYLGAKQGNAIIVKSFMRLLTQLSFKIFRRVLYACDYSLWFLQVIPFLFPQCEEKHLRMFIEFPCEAKVDDDESNKNVLALTEGQEKNLKLISHLPAVKNVINSSHFLSLLSSKKVEEILDLKFLGLSDVKASTYLLIIRALFPSKALTVLEKLIYSQIETFSVTQCSCSILDSNFLLTGELDKDRAKNIPVLCLVNETSSIEQELMDYARENNLEYLEFWFSLKTWKQVLDIIISATSRTIIVLKSINLAREKQGQLFSLLFTKRIEAFTVLTIESFDDVIFPFASEALKLNLCLSGVEWDNAKSDNRVEASNLPLTRLHDSIIDRTKFNPIGFSKSYNFSKLDLSFGITIFSCLATAEINHSHPGIVEYLVYGNACDDPIDMQILVTLSRIFLGSDDDKNYPPSLEVSHANICGLLRLAEASRKYQLCIELPHANTKQHRKRLNIAKRFPEVRNILLKAAIQQNAICAEHTFHDAKREYASELCLKETVTALDFSLLSFPRTFLSAFKLMLSPTGCNIHMVFHRPDHENYFCIQNLYLQGADINAQGQLCCVVDQVKIVRSIIHVQSSYLIHSGETENVMPIPLYLSPSRKILVGTVCVATKMSVSKFVIVNPALLCGT